MIAGMRSRIVILRLFVAAAVLNMLAGHTHAAGDEANLGKGAIVSSKEIELDVVRRMYLGQQRDFIAVNLPEGDKTRERFEQKIIGRTPAQMKAHWSRLVFTGRAWELSILRSDEDIIGFIQANDNAIGYISDASKANGLFIIERF